MSEKQRPGRILTPDGFVSGLMTFDTHVLAIETEAVADSAPMILPGFVDLHVPGGGGADVMQGADAVRTAARLHARHGTTSFLPATITAPEDDLTAALAGIAEVQEERFSGEARVLGAHMEGPFINADRLGAQPPHARPPEAEFLAAVCAGKNRETRYPGTRNRGWHGRHRNFGAGRNRGADWPYRRRLRHRL